MIDDLKLSHFDSILATFMHSFCDFAPVVNLTAADWRTGAKWTPRQRQRLLRQSGSRTCPGGPFRGPPEQLAQLAQPGVRVWVMLVRRVAAVRNAEWRKGLKILRVILTELKLAPWCQLVGRGFNSLGRAKGHYRMGPIRITFLQRPGFSHSNSPNAPKPTEAEHGMTNKPSNINMIGNFQPGDTAPLDEYFPLSPQLDLFGGVTVDHCRECSQPFVLLVGRGRPPAYCSAECRSVANSKAGARWRSQHEIADVIADKLVCKSCSAEFSRPDKGGRLPHYCSQSCRTKGQLEVKRARLASRLTE